MRVIRFLIALVKYLLWGDRVDTQTYDKRITACISCEHLNDKKCGICGCYVKKKARWSSEDCPKNKW